MAGAGEDPALGRLPGRGGRCAVRTQQEPCDFVILSGELRPVPGRKGEMLFLGGLFSRAIDLGKGIIFTCLKMDRKLQVDLCTFK